jgi:curli biogenesis system outer membrane secretion channel CsgG
MKKLAFLLMLFGLLAGCAKPKLYGSLEQISQFAADKAKDGGKLKIAVINGMRNKQKPAYVLGDRLATYIQDDIFRNQFKYKNLAQQQEIPVPATVKPVKFSFVDRQHLDKIMEEQDFNQTDRVDEGSAVKVGKILGATALLVVNLDIQKSEAKQKNVMVRQSYEVWEPETKIDKHGNRVLTAAGKGGKKVKVIKYRMVPKYVGGRQQMVTEQLVRVKVNFKLLDTATSEVKYARVTDSQVYKVSATFLKGQRVPKLKLGSAALESLKSLGHKIGRAFYPIVVRGGFLADNSDPRLSTQDPLGPDLTWDG